MSLSLSDLTTPLTTDQVLNTFLNILETLGIKAKSWRQGGALRTILRVVAGVWAAFTSLAVQFNRGGFLEYAQGGWLTLLARNVYGVSRVDATFATGTVTLSNAGGGVYTLSAGQLIVTSSSLGKAYTNAAGFVLNALSSLDVAIQAVELGSGSSATPGQIDTVQTALPGVTCSNAAAVVGRDQEADDDLRQRCNDRLGVLSGLGPRGAYAYAVRSATRIDGSIVDVNRVSISPSSSTGVVTVYCASPSGPVTPSDLIYIQANVEALARPDSVTANVLSATSLPLSSTLTVWATTTLGLDATTLAATVQAALLSMTQNYPIGGRKKPPSLQGYLFASEVAGTVVASHPAIFACDGATDLMMSAGDVATLSATLTVRFVDA